MSGSDPIEVHLDPEHLLGRVVERNRVEAIPALLRELEFHGLIDNLRRAAGLPTKAPSPTDAAAENAAAENAAAENAAADKQPDKQPEPSVQPREGWRFSDGDVARWLRAASRAGRLDLADPIATILLAAQSPDGYLNSAVTDHKQRYTELQHSKELHVLGAAISAWLAHEAAHERTNSTDTLPVTSRAAAERAAAHVKTAFGGRTIEAPIASDPTPGIELALIELADATGDPKWARVGKRFIEDRLGERLGDRVIGIGEPGGHAAKNLSLLTAAAHIANMAGKDRVAFRRQVLEWWRVVVDTRLYLTGGIGSQWSGESIGGAYELPHDQSFAETCAAVGMIEFAEAIRPLLSIDSTEADDMIERVLHNAFLGAASLRTDAWFSANVHGSVCDDGRDHFANDEHDGRILPRDEVDRLRIMQLSMQRPFRRSWHDVCCCPTNWVGLAARIPSLALDVNGDDIWIRQWTALRAEGPGWSVDVKTNMPWEEGITLAVTTDRPKVVHFRIPAWCAWSRDRGPTVRVGNEPVPVAAGTWCAIPVSAGLTVVSIELPLQPTLVVAHPKVADARGAVAMTRGPIVFCLEGVDHLPLPDVRSVQFDVDGGLTAVYEEDLLDGVVMINATGVHPPDADDGPLYRPWEPARYGLPVDLHYIPYYAWANRGAWAMSIWIALAPGAD
jgi:uncharacterized protein